MYLFMSFTDFINNRGLLRRALHSDRPRKTRVDMPIRSREREIEFRFLVDSLSATEKNSGWHPNRRDSKVLKDRLYYNKSLEMLRKERHVRVKNK